jgi:hypothetical protein
MNSFPEQKAASVATIRPKCKHTAGNPADGVNFRSIRVIPQQIQDILRYLFSLHETEGQTLCLIQHGKTKL